MDQLEFLRSWTLPFADLLDIVYTAAEPDRVTAEMMVRDDMCTFGGILHGGAIMAFADSVGGAATFINLPEGAATTTLESKTNFLRPAPAGEKVLGEATPVHKGRRTMVWQTRITKEDGRLVAVVTQTQMVLEGAAG